MGGIGAQEILLILVVVLVIFGAKKLPEIGSGLGRAIHNFRKASSEPDEIDITPQASRTKKSDDHKDDDKA
jgi:sec-independent protein translocase protein TatA